MTYRRDGGLTSGEEVATGSWWTRWRNHLARHCRRDPCDFEKGILTNRSQEEKISKTVWRPHGAAGGGHFSACLATELE